MILFNNDIKPIFISVFLAVMGGLARLLSHRENSPLYAANVLSGCLTASFLGIVAYFAAGSFAFESNVMYFIAGVSGWIGPHAMDIFTKVISQVTGFNFQVNSNEITEPHPEYTVINENINFIYQDPQSENNPVSIEEPLEES